MNKVIALSISDMLSELRCFFISRKFTKASVALQLAMNIHNGTRKDGVTPEWAHQVNIAYYLYTINSALRLPEDAIILGLLHDVFEDHPGALSNIEVINYFGMDILEGMNSLTYKGSKNKYYEELKGSYTASIVKGVDRMHNLQTMAGVFTRDKVKSYIEETREYVLPMLYHAKNRTVNLQTPAYANIIYVMENQIRLIEAAF
jgi:(p)ppGpp synthase/HD superfamily hydrolase